MKNLFFNFCAFALLVLAMTTNANAQNNKPAPSPASKVTQMVGLTEVTVEYSRPSVKGRTIFSKDGLQAYGQTWRTGANAANKFTFSTEVTINGTKLPAGAYTMTTVPGADEWKVNIYKYDGTNSGAYAEKKADASFMAKSMKLGEVKVETFLIDINNITDTSAVINLVWENTAVSIPFEVPKTW
ncbi:MAG: DUF2911 domain-containing protein [Saprospiraceae bacterium]|nr:DUF2911 domain-containing protein [Saprospiraceae bacterium]